MAGLRLTARRLGTYLLEVLMLAAVLGAFEGIQLVVAGAAYALLFAYLIVALRNEGRRSVPDFAAGTLVDPVMRG